MGCRVILCDIILKQRVDKENGENKKGDGDECKCPLLMQSHHNLEQVINVYEVKVIEPY